MAEERLKVQRVSSGRSSSSAGRQAVRNADWRLHHLRIPRSHLHQVSLSKEERSHQIRQNPMASLIDPFLSRCLRRGPSAHRKVPNSRNPKEISTDHRQATVDSRAVSNQPQEKLILPSYLYYYTHIIPYSLQCV